MFSVVGYKAPRITITVEAVRFETSYLAISKLIISFISSRHIQVMKMHGQLFFLLVIFRNSLIVHSRPEDLFSDFNNQPLGNNVDLFSPEGSGDFLDDNVNPADLALNPAPTSGEDIIDASSSNLNDLFSTEDFSSDPTIPSLQSSTSCETDMGLLMNDDVPQLQTRGDASCAPSKPEENIDSILNLFQDPEGLLRKKIPTTKAPTGQVNQPGSNDEDFNFETFRNRRPIPVLFDEDEETCPSRVFGLSNTPVCHDDIRNPLTHYPGGWTDLVRISPCMFIFIRFS